MEKIIRRLLKSFFSQGFQKKINFEMELCNVSNWARTFFFLFCALKKNRNVTGNKHLQIMYMYFGVIVASL